jgi:GNAT superfamily N-acetyltransferase
LDLTSWPRGGFPEKGRVTVPAPILNHDKGWFTVLRRLLLRGDAERLIACLMGDESANTFMLGNLLYYGVENDRRTLRRGEYWGYFEGGELSGAAAYYNNSQCMVYLTGEAAARQMARDIEDSGARLVLGGDRSVRLLLREMKPGGGRLSARSQLFMERTGEIPAVLKPDTGAAFEDARGREGDRAVQDFILRCMREGFGFSVTRGTVRRLLREKTRYEPYLLLKTGGKYVAQAHIQARTPGFCQIGGVCTLPEERRRGYARAVVERLLGMIAQDGGRKACLVVNSDNEPAKRMYAEMGFRETGRLMLVDIS